MKEIFGAGTACVVCPVSKIAFQDEVITPKLGGHEFNDPSIRGHEFNDPSNRGLII